MNIYTDVEQWRIDLIQNPPPASKLFGQEEWEHIVLNELLCNVPVVSMLGRHHTEETKKLISEANKGKQSRLGAKLSDESKRKIGKANSHPHSEEHRKKVSESLIGNTRRLGILHDEDTKARIRSSMKARGAPHLSNRATGSCQHCGKTMDISNLARYHGDKCKDKK